MVSIFPNWNYREDNAKRYCVCWVTTATFLLISDFFMIPISGNYVLVQRIDTGNNNPVLVAQRRYPEAERNQLDEQVAEKIEACLSRAPDTL